MKTRKLTRGKQTALGFAGASIIALGIYAASGFTANLQPVGYLGGIALSTDFLMKDPAKNPTGGGFMYRPWFENGAYQGDLIQYDVSEDGDATTTIDLGTIPPTNTGDQHNWSARLVFAAQETANATWWSDTRKIITYVDGSQVALRWGNLTADQQAEVDLAQAGNSDSAVLDFIRGDRGNEGPVFRTRWSVLGDIVHSTAVYVGAPKESYDFDAYDSYRSAQASRAGRVYVGANDGMLHAFDAATGEEVWAYVPSMVIGKLDRLTVAPYAPSHTYFVDGPMTVGDAQIGGEWRTILVGTLGAGGKGVFALDVTDPNLSDEDSSSGGDRKVLWELTAGGDDDFGDSYSKPVIARLNDGEWYAIFGNGYNSASGLAKLYLVELATGTVHTRIDTGSGTPGAPNGLSSPVVLDYDGNSMADVAYAGDIDGNLWKFDLDSESVALGGSPLFSAGANKSITVRPDVVSHLSGHLVYFGTGRLFTSGELGSDMDGDGNADTQSIYAIYDKGAPVTSESGLVTQAFTEKNYNTDRVVRALTGNTINWNTNTGWKIDLPAGERLLTDPVVRAKRVQMITTNPAKETQENWIVEPHYLSGGPPEQTVFDLNVDGVLDSQDNVDTNNNGSLTDAIDIAAAWKLGSGVASGPKHAIVDVITGQGTIDTVFYNNLNPPYVSTCSEDCPDGFLTGSLDVMTDSPWGPKVDETNPDGVELTSGGLGGHPNGHQHVYDKVHGVVYVDLLGAGNLDNTPANDAGVSRDGKMEPRRNLTSLNAEAGVGTATKHLNSVEEVFKASSGSDVLDGTKQFIVVLTNADLSKGGTITIGKKQWAVQEYQDMVATKLLALGGVAATSSNFKDADGDSLVFTLNDIKAQGTLRISFNNKSIMDGLVHPTSPMCVSGDREPYSYTDPSLSNMHITKVPSGASKDNSATDGYRWRNGALTVQLLDAADYTLQPMDNGLSGNNKRYWLPVAKSGSTYNLVGGVYAKKFSDVTDGGTAAQSIVQAEGANESGLLFEATMFWHFGDLNILRNGGMQNRCYGSNNWQAAKNIELGGLTLGEYNALLDGMTDSSPEIIAYEKALQDVYGCRADSGCTEATLTNLIKDLNAAIGPIADYVKYRGYAPGHIPEQHLLQIDKQLGESADPVPADDEASTDDTAIGDAGNSVGPNYMPGRRTWIDISPE
jgi:hypothetical protein